jgi:hypothetical protein
MRLEKSSRTLLPLALSAVLATCAFAQDAPNVQPKAADAALKQAPAAPKAPAAPAPKTPAPAAAKKVPAKVMAPVKTPAVTPVKAPAKAPAEAPAAAAETVKTASAAPATPPVDKPAEEKPAVRRDPFDTLLTKARAGNAPPENLPPGKAGLIIEALNIDGIVRSQTGMIAIVSNSQKRVYFLRDGDKLYDGSVEKIALDAISFHEIGKDAFGKPLERVVTKRLYPSSGEQQ